MEAIIFQVVCVFSLQGQFNCLHLNFEFSANKRRYIYTHTPPNLKNVKNMYINTERKEQCTKLC